MSDVRTYSGSSLQQLLPQIREELGDDALIVRQREGVVGGVGGFFGKRVVEVEAKRSTPSTVRSVPARSIVNAYDTDLAAAPVLEAEPAATPTIFETLLEQAAAPFAMEKAQPAAPAPVEAPAPAPPPAPAAAPVPAPARSMLETLRSLAPDETGAVRSELLAAALPVRMVDAILAEVQEHLMPFASGASVRTLARRSLARRIPTAHGWRTKQRTIAVVGVGGSGRTLATASLAAAYADAGRSVVAMSMEPARDAMRLFELLEDRRGVEVDSADTVASVRRVKKASERADLLIADAPPIADAVDGTRLESTLKLLNTLRPQETHLVLAAGTSIDDAHAIVDALAPHKLPSRIIVSHADDQRTGAVPVGIAIDRKIPVSFVGGGSKLWQLRPAEPEDLARMVLR